MERIIQGNMNDVTDRYLETVEKILKKHLHGKRGRVVLFGSQSTGKAKRYSDLDIGILGEDPVPIETIQYIQEDLEESNVPYMVDIVDMKNTSQSFRDIALKGAKEFFVYGT